MTLANRKFNRNSTLLFYNFHLAVTLVVLVMSVNWQPVRAQVCTDATGEIVFTQSFGTVDNPISLDGIATYNYEPSGCPNDNQYTLAPTVDGTCFNSTWHAVLRDHTTNNKSGNMLIVNGGNVPATFYQQSISNLCKGSSYEVSLWAMNILRTNTCLDPLIPDLAIVVETPAGAIIESVALGLIQQADTPTWRRYSITFTTPVGIDNVVIKLVNNQGDYGCGNDLAIDDFQVKQCGECEQGSNLVYVPDAFSPNQDNNNDTLVLFWSAKLVSFSLKIYNRWGSLVFVSTDPTLRWDGTYAGVGCASDVYAWVMAYQTDPQTKREHVQTGQVHLLR